MNSYSGGDQGDLEDKEKSDKMSSPVPEDNILDEYSDILKALGDPSRLKIMYLLKYGELCVCEIFTAMEKPQPTVSHHLKILKNAGLLKWRKDGVWIHYSLSNPQIIDILDQLFKM